MALVYVITNTVTGQQYVGQTKKTLNERFSKHKRQYNSYLSGGKSASPSLYEAVEEYGWDVFTMELLEEVPDDLALSKESYWIRKLKTTEEGYNRSKGLCSNKPLHRKR